jgi:hypothetical protein
LTDLGSGVYQGFQGGLYPGGSVVHPFAHEADGLALARAIGPMDGDGRPSANGRYAFVSIGMSNTTQEFSVFKPLADAEGGKDPRLVIVDGAQGGMTASDWANASCSCWATLEGRLRNAGITAGQVATAWVKLANASPRDPFPAHAQRLRDDIIGVLRLLKERLPNLQMVYLSSRIYGGYATTALNPEPYAYESGFSVKWIIEAQLHGALPYQTPGGTGAVAPWLSWGPYLWADGLIARADGLTWACSDLRESDGTHPSATGAQKVAALLLQFVRTDLTAREWFLANP